MFNPDDDALRNAERDETAAQQSGDVKRGGEDERRPTHVDEPLPRRAAGDAGGEYPAILREYASTGFRDDTRGRKRRAQR